MKDVSEKDVLVEEARRVGQQYVDSFQGDWQALIADLNRRSEREGRSVVALPPKPPRRRGPSRKAG
jgi:hypothetical protein